MGLQAHTHVIQNAMPPSCAKHHEAKPEVLGAQVPHSTVPGVGCICFAFHLVFLMQNF